MKKFILLAMLICLASSLNTGCMFQGKKHNEWQPVEQKIAPVVHTAQWPEETLMNIAKWYTGEDGNWEALANANPNINPDSLPRGTRIFIPGDLVKTREPMPQSFLVESKPQEKKKETPIKKTSAPQKKDQTIDFEVFGPR